MAAPQPDSIVRKPLLKVALGQWDATGVDVRSMRFAPGQQTGVHSHPCPVLGYIAEGAATLQVDGEAEQRLETGAAFYEPANRVIRRFDNASAELPMHFIAIYLLRGEHPLIEMLE